MAWFKTSPTLAAFMAISRRPASFSKSRNYFDGKVFAGSTCRPWLEGEEGDLPAAIFRGSKRGVLCKNLGKLAPIHPPSFLTASADYQFV
jgi:hypothetical protein